MRAGIPRDPALPTGQLPSEAHYALVKASAVGLPGSRERRQAIDKAYAFVENFYPQYLRWR